MNRPAPVTEPLPDKGAAIVAIGDELLAGKHPDLNSSRIAKRLLELDVTVTRVVLVADEQDELAALLRELASRHELVFVTGGLGPTLDDITRHAIADAAGVDLVRDDAVLDGLRAFFKGLGREFPPDNERQALFPRGATIVPNRVGTAPGFRVRVGRATIVSLPGPPREASVVFDEEVFPWLAELRARRGALAQATFHLYGLSESSFAAHAGDWMRRPQNPLMGVSAAASVLTVTLRASGADRAEADRVLAPRAAAVRERFAEWLFSEAQADPAVVLGEELIARGITIALAESCTAGLVAARLADVPGISAVFERAWIVYSDAAKRDVLGVSAETLRRHGAVSAETVSELALGAAERSGARLTAAVSGIAGPGGGSVAKPVGLVWIATCLDGVVETLERRLPDRGRAEVRRLAAQAALFALLQRLRRAAEAV